MRDTISLSKALDQILSDSSMASEPYKDADAFLDFHTNAVRVLENIEEAYIPVDICEFASYAVYETQTI